MVESGLHIHMVSLRSHSFRSALWAVSALAAVSPSFGAKTPTPPSLATASNILRQLPIVFEPNTGAWNRDVKFSARTSDYRLFLTSAGARLSLADRTVSISLLNGNRKAAISGDSALSSHSAYFLGHKEHWRNGIANFGRVRYSSVYPGIDLVYYGSGSQLEYDFMVSPGADPNRIRLQFQGMDRLSISPEGNLVIATAGATLIQKTPVIYQEQPGLPRRAVRGKFKLLSRNVAGFEIESYNRALPLTIDPVLTYSSLIGSSGADAVTALKVDPAGMIYAVGYMTNVNDVTGSDSAFQTTAKGGQDIFLAKINPAASGAASLLYFSFIGGSGADIPTAIALDSAGNVYITGSTTSIDFPLAGNTPSATLGGTTDAFLVKFQPAAQGIEALPYATYLGGSDIDVGNAIDVDSQGAAYITGYTRSGDFPLTSSAYQAVRWGNQDSFITKLNPVLASPIVYSSYLGGETTDEGRAILVGPNGAVYFAANTFSATFPLAGNPYRDSPMGGGDVVIGQLDLTKSGVSSLIYTTYLGGSGLDEVSKLALDSRGRLLIAGTTLSTDFPVTSDGFQQAFGGIANAFLARLDLTAPRDSALSYSTYLGGSGGDVTNDMAVDGSGNVYLTGYTLSPDFPTTSDALQQTSGGGINVFITKLNLSDPKPAGLVYSTYVGETGTNVGYAIAIAPNGSICIGGQSAARNIITTDSAFQGSFEGGVTDGFVMVLQ